MLLIILIVFFVLAFIMILRVTFAWQDVISQFRDGNVLVYGRKGKGKDLLFSAVIYKRRKEGLKGQKGKHYSNIYYNDKTEIIPLESLRAGNNTYENFIYNKLEKFSLDFDEKIDVYISEAGLNFPCQYNNELNKRYPSLPVYYALTRHLTNSNIHCNTQALTRPWDKLREQADCYIRCMKIVKWLPFYLLVKVRVYDEYEDAKNNLAPLFSCIFDSREGKALREVELSSRGNIREYWLPIAKRHVHYDTRYFKSVLLK